jgi:hypothetical protein
MATQVDRIYEEVMGLPDELKATLAERIVEHLVTHVNPDLELLQLDIVKRRRDEVRKNKVAPLDGADVLIEARKLIRK